MTIEFVDVSHFHPVNDWPAYLASGAPALAFKVGGDAEDPTWKAHDQSAADHDLVRLGYWLPPNPPGAAISSANDFLATFPPATGRIPVLDDEGYISLAWRAAFCATVAKAWGRACWYYGSEGRTAGKPYPKWTAKYSATAPSDGWVLWQYSSSGTWPGVQGTCDLNQLAADKDVAWLRTQAGLEDDVALNGNELNGLAYLFGQQRRVKGNPVPTTYTASDGADRLAAAVAGWSDKDAEIAARVP